MFAESINSTVGQRDIFLAANLSVILFFPSSLPPPTLIAVILSQSRSETAKNCIDVQKQPDNTPQAKAQPVLNASNILALFQECFPDLTIVVQDSGTFTIGISYSPGDIPTCIILNDIETTGRVLETTTSLALLSTTDPIFHLPETTRSLSKNLSLPISFSELSASLFDPCMSQRASLLRESELFNHSPPPSDPFRDLRTFHI